MAGENKKRVRQLVVCITVYIIYQTKISTRVFFFNSFLFHFCFYRFLPELITHTIFLLLLLYYLIFFIDICMLVNA